MAIILRNSRFMRVPKTGSTWVVNVLNQLARLHGYEYAVTLRDRSHTPLIKAPGKQLFTFGFVRNPLTWYQSYWAYCSQHGWGSDEFDHNCRSHDFQHFMDLVLDKHAGMATQTFQNFTGFLTHPIDFIGKQESLREDLEQALILAGEDILPELMDQLPPMNTSAYEKYIPKYRPDQIEAVILADKETFQYFGYPKELPHGRDEGTIDGPNGEGREDQDGQTLLQTTSEAAQE